MEVRRRQRPAVLLLPGLDWDPGEYGTCDGCELHLSFTYITQKLLHDICDCYDSVDMEAYVTVVASFNLQLYFVMA